MLPVFIPRVRLKNYKSISACDVELRELTFLLGANGSGKSNFVDALRFVADSLRTSLDHALRDRGGIKEVRRRSGGHPTHFEIRLDFEIEGQTGHFAFRIGAKPKGGFEVQNAGFTLAKSVSTQEREFLVKCEVVFNTPGSDAALQAFAQRFPIATACQQFLELFLSFCGYIESISLRSQLHEGFPGFVKGPERIFEQSGSFHSNVGSRSRVRF